LIRISVIIAVTSPSPYLDRIRESLTKVSSRIEIIIVAGTDLQNIILPKFPNEKIIHSGKKGRGFAFSQGFRSASGEITLCLHADTFLPNNWDNLLLNALDNNKIVGGAFSLKFDTQKLFLKFLISLSDLFFYLTGELWGDRAIFFRSEILKDHSQIMEVPIMEDVILSHFMGKKGEVILLKEQVVTSSATFEKFGYLGHAFRILKCRLWFALGGSPKKIFSYYYP
jgi:glycosyltransferase involved in cell wall biosynthesis